MRIESQGYTLTVSNEEMYDLIWALIYRLRAGEEHAARHNGMATLIDNNPTEFDMLKDLCRASGYLDLYEREIGEIKDRIDKQMGIDA